MTPLIKEACSLDADVALACVWFDMGTVEWWGERLDVQGMRLPFEKCGVVSCDSFGNACALLVTQAAEDVILVSAHDMRRASRLPMFAIHMQADELVAEQVDGEGDLRREDVGPLVGMVAEFLRQASPTGYRATIKRSPTNTRRAAKGKSPLIYSWHTLQIEPPQERQSHQGGTHATPRLHQRRGHWRSLAGGKRVWVRDCMVGDASRGTVWKDYRTNNRSAEAAP